MYVIKQTQPMKKMNINNCVHPQPKKRFHTDSKKGHTLEYDPNIRAILTSFYLGTGGVDVGGFTSFVGLPSGRSWEKFFHRHSSKIKDVVIYVTATVIQEAVVGEIKATIQGKLNEKTEAEIEKVIENDLAKN